MVHRSLSNLRLDRRLLRRPDWICEEDLEKELSGLPDASQKIAPPEEPPHPQETPTDSGA